MRVDFWLVLGMDDGAPILLEVYTGETVAGFREVMQEQWKRRGQNNITLCQMALRSEVGIEEQL